MDIVVDHVYFSLSSIIFRLCIELKVGDID